MDRTNLEMIKISELANAPLKWVQPRLRWHFELRFGETIFATLRFQSAFKTIAWAESGDGSWVFKRFGFWQNQASIWESGTEKGIAIFKQHTWKRGGILTFNHGNQYKIRANFWFTKFDWLDMEENPLATFNMGGFFKQNADVEVLPRAATLAELPILVLFGWYIILIKIRDAAVVTTAAAS